MNPAIALAALAGLGLGFGLWCLISLLPRLSRPRLARRVAPYILDISSEARALMAPRPPGPLPVLGVLVNLPAASGAAVLGGILGGAVLVARRLRQAGVATTVESFRAEQLLWGLGGGVVGVAVAAIVGSIHSPPALIYPALVVAAAVAGVVARDYVLQRSARRRLARLSSELPVVLEFVTLSLSAGEGILDAIRRVARVSSGELSRELAGVAAAANTGLPFGETLSALADGLDLPAFSRCVEQIVGALDRGTPLAEVLRAQAQDARDEAKRGLLERAGKNEIAMLFPLVFLILPVTILFALLPGIALLELGL